MRRRLVQLILGAVLCLMPALASAQPTTLATANPGVLGQGRLLGLAASSQQYIRYRLTANRSYYAVCWSGFSTDQTRDCNDVDWRNSSDVSVTTSSEIEPFDGSFTSYGGDGDSVLPTVSGDYYVRVSSIAGGNVMVMVIENTLFSPWWYGLPSAGYDSWVQIKNNTAQTISVTLRVYQNTGTVLATSAQSVPANGVVLVQVGSLVPAGGAGGLTLTFAGPPGSITANTTTLSGSTGLSFDAPFTPRMNWSSFGYLQ